MTSYQIDIPPASVTTSEDEAGFENARSVLSPGLGPESRPRAGVAAGTLRHGRHIGTAVYPGVERDYFVYLPASAGRSAPLALMVFQDASLYLQDRFSPTVVFDNLIASGHIPPLAAVFVAPGDWPNAPAQSQGNRSIEYDATDDRYVNFLLGELLPVALDGIAAAADPKDRAICGMSSGGICAFNAAWHRPDQFSKVVSHCGSFTNIRDGHLYPSWVRKHARKPIRVFLQTGAADLDNYWGTWATANLDMAAALRFRGYDHRLEFGLGGHDLGHAAAIFPNTLRWIWRKSGGEV